MKNLDMYMKNYKPENNLINEKTIGKMRMQASDAMKMNHSKYQKYLDKFKE